MQKTHKIYTNNCSFRKIALVDELMMQYYQLVQLFHCQ